MSKTIAQLLGREGEWLDAASAGGMTTLAEELCRALADPARPAGPLAAAAASHGALRAEQGAGVDALCRELTALRAPVEARLRGGLGALAPEEMFEAQARLGALLEQLLPAAVGAYLAQYTRALSDQARRDPLTGLLNRATFDLVLADEVDRARRYRRELSLVFLDLDRFKSVNDQFGHPAGDQMLLSFAGILQSSLRHSDLAFRHGGDEFAAVCPETAGPGLEAALDRLERKLRRHCAGVGLGDEVGISWGVASFPADAGEAAGLIRLADERLYACKKRHHAGERHMRHGQAEGVFS